LTLPAWPDPADLREACDAAQEEGRAFAAQAEKDFALGRLLWAIGDEFGDELLLKGGTCLSKVDLGFHRVSEDADFVKPWPAAQIDDLEVAKWYAHALPRIRKAAAEAQLDLDGGPGIFREQNRNLRSFRLRYPSVYGMGNAESLLLEISPRPVLRTPRRVRLQSVVRGQIQTQHADASCFALDADEVRAEKVRAAFTREEIRDFFDLGLFLGNSDLISDAFIDLVDAKLDEWPAPRLRDQPANFGKSGIEIKRLRASVPTNLVPQLPPDTPAFSLDAVLTAYNDLWGK
jgi:hypothetical protein